MKIKSIFLLSLISCFPIPPVPVFLETLLTTGQSSTHRLSSSARAVSENTQSSFIGNIQSRPAIASEIQDDIPLVPTANIAQYRSSISYWPSRLQDRSIQMFGTMKNAYTHLSEKIQDFRELYRLYHLPMVEKDQNLIQKIWSKRPIKPVETVIKRLEDRIVGKQAEKMVERRFGFLPSKLKEMSKDFINSRSSKWFDLLCAAKMSSNPRVRQMAVEYQMKVTKKRKIVNNAVINMICLSKKRNLIARMKIA